jgi:hypothetical protein
MLLTVLIVYSLLCGVSDTFFGRLSFTLFTLTLFESHVHTLLRLLVTLGRVHGQERPRTALERPQGETRRDRWCCERSIVQVADARPRFERRRRLDVQRPKVAVGAAAAADLLGRQPLGELAAARLK